MGSFFLTANKEYITKYYKIKSKNYEKSMLIFHEYDKIIMFVI